MRLALVLLVAAGPDRLHRQGGSFDFGLLLKSKEPAYSHVSALLSLPLSTACLGGKWGHIRWSIQRMTIDIYVLFDRKQYRVL